MSFLEFLKIPRPEFWSLMAGRIAETNAIRRAREEAASKRR